MNRSILANPAAFAQSLTAAERAALLRALSPGAWQRLEAPLLPKERLNAVESMLRQRAEAAERPDQRLARQRLWLVFMLLRHGGLRLREILNLRADDCQFSAGLIHAGGRQTPLAPQTARVLSLFWSAWHGRTASEFPLRCDASQIRRGLSQCGRACGLPAGMLNARALRRHRGLELEAEGMHPRLVEIFLGAKAEADGASLRVIRAHIESEDEIITSARNVFHGAVAEMADSGILVSAQITTNNGLAISAMITRASRRRLGLAPGAPATALVKAPFVAVQALGAEPAPNQFPCVIESISRDERACEINLALEQGGRMCSLYAEGRAAPDGLGAGAKAIASFSPFAVILTSP